MHSNVHIVESSSKEDNLRMPDPPALMCSSRSLSSGHDNKNSSTVSSIISPADIVALDHSYSLPWKADLVPGRVKVKPSTANEQCNILRGNSAEKMEQLEKADSLTPDKLSMIIKKEKEDSRPQIEDYSPGSANFIFLIKPELPQKSVNRSLKFPTNVKCGAPSPTMSKLETLLKNQVRPSLSRRSPSSFLSPSLNYHRGKNLASPDLSGSSHETVDDQDSDIEIDIESVDPDPEPLYDTNKAKNLMKDCEKNLNFLRETEVPEDWEDQIVKTGWTNSQIDVFENILKALHQDRLSRLVNQNRFGEPILRRLSIDKTAQRFRKVLGFYKWNTTLTQWLHGVLVENLSLDYLSAYLDVLQTLRAILPDFVDKMTVLTTGPPGAKLLINPLVLSSPEKSEMSPGGTPNISALEEANKRNINATAISLVLKRKWDPFSSVIQLSKTKKHPSAPIFVFITANPIKNQSITKKKKKRFVSLLASRGKVISVTLNMTAHVYMRVQFYLAKLLKVAAQRVRDLKRQYPDRPVFAVGWTSGSVLACKLSAIEPVAGVIAFGFPMRGVFKRECLSMMILQANCPSLFVMGGLSNYSSVLDMEILSQDNRWNILVIGCANDELRISNNYRRQLLVTQSYVDNCIVDEIMKFISTLQLPQKNPEKSTSAPKTNKKSKLSASLVSPTVETLATDSGTSAKVENKHVKKNNPPVEEIKDFTMFDFDGPPTIPSNTSSNKRKAYFRRTPSNALPAETPSASIPCITASQLVQQSPGVKKRYSKPSGPNVPMPQTKTIVQSESTSCIQNDNSLQKQQQSLLMPSTTNTCQDSVPQSMVLNLLPNSPKVLRIEKVQESSVASKVAATNLPCAVDVDTNVEHSTPASNNSSANDSGTILSLPQSLDFPLQNKQIVKDTYENSGSSKDLDDSEPVVLAQIRPTSKILPINAPIITAPTILPGGATATPFIRTNVPAASQQQFVPSLHRMLLPSPANICGRPLLATPKPTRCVVDLTETAPSTNRLLPLVSKLLSNEISGPNSSINQKLDEKNKAQLPVNSVQKPFVKSSEMPTVKIPGLEHTKTYILTSRTTKSTTVQKVGSETSVNPPKENLPSLLDSVNSRKEKTELQQTESKNGETSSEEAKWKNNLTPKSTDDNVKEESFVSETSGKVDAAPAGENDSDDEIQIVSETRASDPLSLSEADVEKALDVSKKKFTSTSTVNSKVTKEKLPKNMEENDKKKEEKIRGLKALSSPETKKIKQISKKPVGVNEETLKNKQKGNSKRKESEPVVISLLDEKDDDAPIAKSFIGAVKLVREGKHSSNPETKNSKSAIESTRKTRNESKLIESKKLISGQEDKAEKSRKPSNGETGRNDDETRKSTNKKNGIGNRSVDKKKLENVKASPPTKRVVSKGQKHPAKESISPEVDPPKKLKIAKRLSGQNLPKSGNVAMKTASKVVMKASTFFEKNKTLNTDTDSPASRTRNRSGGNSTTVTSVTASQKSKLSTPKKRARLIVEDDADTSDSSIEVVEEVKVKQKYKYRAKRTSLQKKKHEVISSSSSSTSESGDKSESEDSEEEFEDKEIVPRVTRSMKRQSVPR